MSSKNKYSYLAITLSSSSMKLPWQIEQTISSAHCEVFVSQEGSSLVKYDLMSVLDKSMLAINEDITQYNIPTLKISHSRE